MVVTMMANPGMEPELQNQLKELTNVWERVQKLSDLRESKLQDSLRLVRLMICMYVETWVHFRYIISQMPGRCFLE